MDNYIVSARKYRPTTFHDVVGQRALTTTLKNAIHSNKLAHAYLFCGPRGVGKTSCARIFAKTINCLNPTADGEACNECESCKAFNEQRSLNIHELDAASNNSVDDIRALIDQTRIPPTLGKYKVFIIDEVHMLSAAAFNAFLKTLEEPPSYVIFILATTEKQKVIPTILSRCQIYDFSRITIDDTVRHLQYVASRENVQAEEAALNVIAQKADGGMRDALSMFDQAVSFTNGNVTYQAVIDNLNILDYDYYFRFTENILNGNVRNSLLLLNEILGKGFDAQNVITGLASHFRNLLVCKDEETLVLFEVASSVKEQYKEIAKKCPEQFLFKAIELCNTCDLNYRDSRNKRLLVELTLIKLCQLLNVPTPPVGGDGSGKLGSVSAPAGTQAAQPRPNAAIASNVSSSVKKTQQEPSKQPAQPTSATPNIDKIMTSGASSSGVGKRMARPSQTTSLKDLRAKVGDDGGTSEQSAASVKKESSIFNQKEFDEAWDAIAQKYDKVNMFLKDIMLNYRPRLSDGGALTMCLVNAGQKEEINSNMIDIITELRTKLRNSYVHIDIVMEEQEKLKVPITSAEKYEHLANINPLLRQLTKEFDLRLN